MLKAFSLVEASKKLPYDITAFESWSSKNCDGKREEKFFIVCWDKCHAGVYKLIEGDKDLQGDEAQHDPAAEAVNLIRSFKNTTPKPITQVAVFPEFDFFLGLSDGEVYLITLSAGQIMERLMKGTKALGFAVDWTRLRAKSDSRLRICVGSKKRLHIFQYDKTKQTMSPSSKGELPLPAPPKGVAWLGDSVITCLKRDQYYYMAISTDDGTTEELFPAGNVKHDAVMLQLPTRELAVMVDKKMIIINIDLKQMGDIMWSEPPIDVVYSEPYFLALLPSSVVEVRARHLSGIVQKVEMDKLKLIAGLGFHTFVTTNRDVVYLKPTSFSEQCNILVDRCQQYDLALSIAELIPEGHEANKERKTKIKEKYAFHLFVQRNYKEALKLFTGVEADPQHVIALYPTLLPSETRRKILKDNFPSWPPTLAGEQLDKATVVLVEYLNEICRMLELTRSGLEDQEAAVPLPASWEIRDESKMITLLVTTILKCYLAINQFMVAPFVRRRGKALDLQESEKCLKKHKRYEELVELYSAKGKHEEALSLLFDCHKNSPTPTLEGISPTIKYLEMLGNENIEIIFRFSVWVLNENAEGGLKIFTDDQDEVWELDRVRVVQHLEETCEDNPTIVQQYLEHVTHEWRDSNPLLHNKLVELYRDKVQALLESGKDASVVRKKLLLFLKTSQHYTAESVITSFPHDALFQEHALLMGRLGRHEVALAIYAHILKDHDLALQHCLRYKDQETSAEVYHTLIGVYISPPNLSDFGLTLPKGCVVESDIPSAIFVLNNHYDKIDTAKVLDQLPGSTEMSTVVTFLRLVFQNCSHKRRQLQVLRGLTYSQHLQVNRESIESFDKAFVVTDDTTCAVCEKRLAGAFAREPDGRLRHMYCDL